MFYAPETTCCDGAFLRVRGDVSCLSGCGGSVGVEAHFGGGSEGAEEAGEKGGHGNGHDDDDCRERWQEIRVFLEKVLQIRWRWRLGLSYRKKLGEDGRGREGYVGDGRVDEEKE